MAVLRADRSGLSVLPAMIAYQVDKGHVAHDFGRNLPLRLDNLDKFLLSPVRADRNEHNSWICELLEQRRRDIGRTSRDNDSVIGGCAGPAQRAVSQLGRDIVNTQFEKAASGTLVQLRHAFHGDDTESHGRQNCCLVP